MNIFSALLALACTLLGVQAFAASPTDQSPGVESSEGNFEIAFLHRGSPQLLQADLSKGVIFVKVLVNGREVWALVDNGSDNTIIDISIAKEIGAVITPLNGSIRTTSKFLETKLAQNINVVVPKQLEFSRDVFALDLRPVSEVISRPIGLILGRDILSRISFVVDAQFSRILFAPSGAMNFSGGDIQNLPFQNGVLSAEVNGKTAQLAIDLGSNYQFEIFEHSWLKFFPRTIQSRTVSRTDASGTIKNSDILDEITVRVGSNAESVSVLRSESPISSIDGYIGFAFFRDKLLVIDEPLSKLTLIKRAQQ